MKRRYDDGGSVYTAEKGAPPDNTADMRSSPPPSTRGIFTAEKIGKVKTPKGEKLPRDLMPSDLPPTKKAKGGSASSRADGIAQRGKTRGTVVMCGGGMYKK